jgi:hypothetical protein
MPSGSKQIWNLIEKFHDSDFIALNVNTKCLSFVQLIKITAFDIQVAEMNKIKTPRAYQNININLI